MLEETNKILTKRLNKIIEKREKKSLNKAVATTFTFEWNLFTDCFVTLN